jgi:hypothetical protein
MQNRAKTIPLTAAVRAAPEHEFRQEWSVAPSEDWIKREMQETVSNLVLDLRRTGLFRDIVPWTPGVQFDVLIEALRAYGIRRCGTPFVLRPYTLYLVSGESSYTRMYTFRFVSPSDGKSIEFRRDYIGTYYAPSILILPFLSWQKRTTESDLLRRDLLAVREQIIGLAEKKQ